MRPAIKQILISFTKTGLKENAVVKPMHCAIKYTANGACQSYVKDDAKYAVERNYSLI